MRTEPKRLAMNGNEPMVDQGELNGWHLSWNPDTNRFHVESARRNAVFKEWRNAVGYARKCKA